MNTKKIVLLLVISLSLLVGCNRKEDINLDLDLNTKVETKKSVDKMNDTNIIEKIDGTTVYVNGSSPVDLSEYSNLNNNSINDIEINKKARLYTFKYNDKNMYFIYTQPEKKEVDLIDNLKGTEITGVITSFAESSLQIQDDDIYKVSLNCYVYTSENEYKPYSELISQIKPNCIGKVLIANNEVVSMKLF